MSKIKSTHLNTKSIALLALFLATEIVLSRFLSIALWNLKIGFAFLPLVLAARKYGPSGGMIVGGLGDFVGAILFPIGAYYPGFTLTAILNGFVFGFVLHKKCNLPRIIVAVLIAQIFGSLLLNTLWISRLYGSPFIPLFISRIVQVCISIVIEIITLPIVLKYMQKFERSNTFSKIS